MTREELARHDGRDGRKAYVAVNGSIYDFTGSTMWVDGDHQGAHQAGRDLTEELKSAPHVRAVIERFPVVGRLETAAAEGPKKGNRGRMLAIAAIIVIVIGVIVAIAL